MVRTQVTRTILLLFNIYSYFQSVGFSDPVLSKFKKCSLKYIIFIWGEASALVVPMHIFSETSLESHNVLVTGIAGGLLIGALSLKSYFSCVSEWFICQKLCQLSLAFKFHFHHLAGSVLESKMVYEVLFRYSFSQIVLQENFCLKRTAGSVV